MKEIPIRGRSFNFSFTISYEKVVPAPDVDEVFKKSYADIQFRNLRTFSGDVYKAKIFTKEKGSQGDFEKIADVVLDAQNQAEKDKVAIWSGTFDMPEEWRKKNK